MTCTNVTTLTENPGFRICDWVNQHTLINASCNTVTQDLRPEWDGIFDTRILFTGNTYWYFTGQSMLNWPPSGINFPKHLPVSADQTTGFGTPGWNPNLGFTKLFWNGAQWILQVTRVFQGPPINGDQVIWNGIGASVDPLNPVGLYTRSGFQPFPATMTIAAATVVC